MKHIKLFESYQSQKELELLSSIILDKMINKALINNTVSLSSFPKIKFSDIEISNFDVLKDFLRVFKDTEIVPISKNEFVKYSKIGSALYLGVNKESSIQRYILIQISDYLLSEINDLISDNSLDKAKERFKLIISTDLIHELQHGFDDFRSGGKFKKYDINNFDLETYINIPFEVDARFTEAISKTKFYREDFEAIFKYDLSATQKMYEMIPFEEAYNNFLKHLDYKEKLNTHEKKRILKRFGAFYEKEKTFVNQHNKKTIKP